MLLQTISGHFIEWHWYCSHLGGLHYCFGGTEGRKL